MAGVTIYEIDGGEFSTLEEFFEEFGRAVIPGFQWGRNLDALDDVLYGGFGTPDEGFVLRWKNHDLSRQRLGYPETVRQLEKRCHPTNRDSVRRELQLASEGEGPTVYQWLAEIITGHGPGGEDPDHIVKLELV